MNGKYKFLIMAAVFVLASHPAYANTDTAAAQRKKTVIMVGAVEKAENDKFVMRKTEARYEFYLDEATALYLREEADSSSAGDRNYLVIRGPKNRHTVLANSVYVYENKAEYDAASDKKDESDQGPRVFSANIEGYVVNRSPLVVRLADGRDFTVSHDEDTYWMRVKKTNASEIKPGERIKLYFDRIYSIRLKNVPVKVVIDRVKAGF